MARYGIAISARLDELGDLARACEDAGFESLWVPETARTAYVQAAVVGMATQRARIGTSIALAFPRSPVITAMEARDLAELTGGRFILGLGTQVKRVNEFRYSTPFEHPMPKLREAIEVCREVWAAFAGEPIDHQGRFYTVTMPPFPGAGPAGPIPVHIAAVNEGMVRMAGEVCDGWLGHPFTSVDFLVEKQLPVLREGAEAAGRKLGDIEIVQSVITSISDDREEAYRAAKLQIGFYGTTRTYRGVFEQHGWGDVVDPLRAAFRSGDLGAMEALITDEMAETYSAAGTPDEVREKVKRFEPHVDTIMLNAPWALAEGARATEVFRRLIDTFGPLAAGAS